MNSKLSFMAWVQLANTRNNLVLNTFQYFVDLLTFLTATSLLLHFHNLVIEVDEQIGHGF
jgi:hypothetical protein